MYKKGVFEKSLIKRGGTGVQYKKKKKGPGGPRNEEKEGAGGSNFQGVVSLPLTFFNGIARTFSTCWRWNSVIQFMCWF